MCVPRLESPTRSLLMEAPKGIQILAEAGDIQAICRNELRLESKDGEVGPTTLPVSPVLVLWKIRTELPNKQCREEAMFYILHKMS